MFTHAADSPDGPRRPSVGDEAGGPRPFGRWTWRAAAGLGRAGAGTATAPDPTAGGTDTGRPSTAAAGTIAGMQSWQPDRVWPLMDAAATRRAERLAAAAGTPSASDLLMQRAGLAVARLALAVAPHARRIWVACGPGNNGGDGFEAALHLRRRGIDVSVGFAGDPQRLPPDAARALGRLQAAGINPVGTPPAEWDLGIDALLGLGGGRPLSGRLGEMAAQLQQGPPVLAVDLPSGLSADTGVAAPGTPRARWTLALLSLKPGLFMADGRDHAGDIWFDDLGITAGESTAWLSGPPRPLPRPHASHKGRFGDVAVIGGAPGMAGAALLAARAALAGGAGRVYCGLLDRAAPTLDPVQPALMLRPVETLEPAGLTVVCGCGGGDGVRAVLPRLLSTAAALVLDADGLNAVAADPAPALLLAARGRRGAPTVLTPHPLEAARLLGCDAATVQADRLRAASELARRFGAVVLLKGSGSVTAAPDEPPWINPTGNGRLATAGTGDVLAGLVGARLAQGQPPLEAARDAAWDHGRAAEHWPADRPLTAEALAMATAIGRGP